MYKLLLAILNHQQSKLQLQEYFFRKEERTKKSKTILKMCLNLSKNKT